MTASCHSYSPHTQRVTFERSTRATARAEQATAAVRFAQSSDVAIWRVARRQNPMLNRAASTTQNDITGALQCRAKSRPVVKLDAWFRESPLRSKCHLCARASAPRQAFSAINMRVQCMRYPAAFSFQVQRAHRTNVRSPGCGTPSDMKVIVVMSRHTILSEDKTMFAVPTADIARFKSPAP